jgi:hypothetical protein
MHRWHIAGVAVAIVALLGCKEPPGKPLRWSSTTMLEFDIAPSQHQQLLTFQFFQPYESPGGRIQLSGFIKGSAQQKADLPQKIDFLLTHFGPSTLPTTQPPQTYDLSVPVKKNGSFKVKSNDFPGFTFSKFDRLNVDMELTSGMLLTGSTLETNYAYISR